MTKNLLTIPDSLVHPIFFTDQIDLSGKSISNWNPQLFKTFFFPYELCYYNELDCFRPWEHHVTVIPQLVSLWVEEEKVVSQLFAQRNTNEAGNHMKRGISLLISGVFWMNEQPVNLTHLNNNMSMLTSTPVNLAERLEFIMEKPQLYHASIQLKQLFTELEKAYYKNIALKKTSKREA